MGPCRQHGGSPQESGSEPLADRMPESSRVKRSLSNIFGDWCLVHSSSMPHPGRFKKDVLQHIHDADPLGRRIHFPTPEWCAIAQLLTHLNSRIADPGRIRNYHVATAFRSGALAPQMRAQFTCGSATTQVIETDECFAGSMLLVYSGILDMRGY